MKKKAYFTCSCGRRYMKKETAMCCVTSGCKRCGKVTKPDMANTYYKNNRKSHNVDFRADHHRPVTRRKTVLKVDTTNLQGKKFSEGERVFFTGYQNMVGYPVFLYRGENGTLALPKDKVDKYLKVVNA